MQETPHQAYCGAGAGAEDLVLTSYIDAGVFTHFAICNSGFMIDQGAVSFGKRW